MTKRHNVYNVSKERVGFETKAKFCFKLTL